MEQALVRTRKTEPLYKMARQERKKSLQGAFSLASGADVRGKHILLLDDILTTGATLSGCACLLYTSASRASWLR